MKASYFLVLSAIILLCIQTSRSQNIPYAFSYQALAQNTSGEVVSEKEILAEISIIRDTETGTIEYQEIHHVKTDAYGFFNFNIGTGNATFAGSTSLFSQIPWSEHVYFLKIRIDINSGEFINGLIDLGTNRLQSVPYALASIKADEAKTLSLPVSLKLVDLADISIENPSDQQTIRWNGSLQKWEAALPGGVSGEFLRSDGSSDLSGNWTISKNDITLQLGNLTLDTGTISANALQLSNNQRIISFSNDGSFTNASDSVVPTGLAVKQYVDASNGIGTWMSNDTSVYYSGTKRVGIGTDVPMQKLHVSLQIDESFLVEGINSGDAPDLNAGTRLVFIPAKSAFRAGTVQNHPDWWNSANLGQYSAAFGLDTKAFGDYSFACGKDNTATGNYSFALGRNNSASNVGAGAFGNTNSAGGLYSICFGQNNTTIGINAFATGDQNTVRGTSAFCVGSQNHTGNVSGSGGDYSLASGLNTGAEASGCFSGGNLSLAKGNYSFAFGVSTQTNSNAVGSFALGNTTATYGEYTLATGFGTQAKSYLESVFGRYNATFGSSSSAWVSGEALFSVGNGTGESARSNAFVIIKNGNIGIGLGAGAPQSLLDVGLAGDGTFARANAWNLYSDIKLKTDLSKISNSSAIIDSLNGYYFYWKTGPDKLRQIGVVAQEVEKFLPELVTNDNKGIKSVDYSKLTAVLIEAFKEQRIEIEQLKKENIELREHLKRSDARLDDVEKYVRAAANLNMNK